MKKIVKVILIFLIVTLTISFSIHILKDKKIQSNMKGKFLEDPVVCPSNMDLNRDGVVNQTDIDDLQSVNGHNPIDQINEPYDVNQNGEIEDTDITLYAECYNQYHNFNFTLAEGVTFRVSEDNKVISRLNANTHVVDFITLFTFTAKEVYVTDGDGNIKLDNNLVSTGDKLIIETIAQPKIKKEFHISVIGDVLKTGEVTLNDAKKIAVYVVDQNIHLIPNSVVALAADINDDGEIKMNDVVQLVKTIELRNDH